MNTEKINSKKIITTYAGEEYKLHIVDKDFDYNEDLFYETYQKAFQEVIKIIGYNNQDDSEILEMSNNIIAFCGERGQGKSSAMISFAKILENSRNDNIEKYFREYVKKLNNKTFYPINRIDPTELENQQSILNVILSRIFFKFKEAINNNIIDNFYEKNEILKLFQKCFKSVNLIKEKSEKSSEPLYGDDLEFLSNLGDNTEIKKNLSTLINKFLNFVAKKDYLVILIDDSDLNVKNAYSITEDIRKYLMIPNVIILMAAKTDQFNKAVEQEYVNSFKLLADAGQMPYHQFYQMATKYISKLIPGTRKINLPDLSFYSDTEEFDYHLKYIEKTKNNEKDKKIIINDDLQRGLLDFIYKKTGLIFLVPSNHTHNIVPNTMRELVNLLSVLNNLKDLKEYRSFEEMDSEYIIRRISNLQVFEKYFIDSWIEENVYGEYHKYINDWYKASWKNKNKLLIYYLSGMIPALINSNPQNENFMPKSINRKKNIYQEDWEENLFSFGNSLNKLDELDSICPLNEIYKFTFAIRTLFSINLNKFILQRIAAEKKGNCEKLKDINEYIVSVFGDKINDYVPKENRVGYIDINKNFNRNRNRASFSIEVNSNNYEKFKSILDENNENFIFELFCDLQEQNITGNGRRISYDISTPLIKTLLYPLYIKQNEEYDQEYFQKLRYICFCIISNFDVLHKVKKYLQIKTNPGIGSGKEGLINHIGNFYDRILKALQGISEIKLTVDFNKLIEGLKNATDVLDFIYNRGFVDNDEAIKDFIQNLYPYISTDTTDKLNDRMHETYVIFSRLYNYEIFDTRKYINDLRTLEKKRNGSKKKEVKKSTCLEYQAQINKLRANVKKELEAMVK